jgi:hypothetical protein
MNWTKETLESYLQDKKGRSVDINEYLLLISFINKIKPKTLIDVGTYLGASAYILGTCCGSIEEIYTIDNVDSPEYFPKDEATREEHGKYAPEEAIFIKTGYEDNLKSLIKDGNEFVFWDAGKNTMKVMGQLQMSRDLGVRFIAIHDSGEVQATVRRAILRAVRFKWYKIIEEDINSCKEKGVTLLELIK